MAVEKRTPTYYEILGVDEHATREEMRTVMLAAVRRYDANPNAPGADAQASRITTAWHTLQDPDTRRRYDEQLHLIRHPRPMPVSVAVRHKLNEIAGIVTAVVGFGAVVLAAAAAYYLVGGAIGTTTALIVFVLFHGDDSMRCDCDCSERHYTREEREQGLHLRREIKW